MLSVSRLDILARVRFTLRMQTDDNTDSYLVARSALLLSIRPGHSNMCLLFVLGVGLGSERCFARALLPVVSEAA